MAKKQRELRKLAQDSNAADKRVAEKENVIRDMEGKLEQLNKDFFEVIPDATLFPFFSPRPVFETIDKTMFVFRQLLPPDGHGCIGLTIIALSVRIQKTFRAIAKEICSTDKSFF